MKQPRKGAKSAKVLLFMRLLGLFAAILLFQSVAHDTDSSVCCFFCDLCALLRPVHFWVRRCRAGKSAVPLLAGGWSLHYGSREYAQVANDEGFAESASFSRFFLDVAGLHAILACVW